jgi:hypothetical protein
MAAFSDWFPLAAAGITFTTLGSLKVYGLMRGFEGGRGKPMFEYVCGT